MKNEEAIKYFKRHLDLYCVDGISREAEEMAIQALSQQPCDDTISRRNIIDTYKSCADMLSDEELKGADLVMEWVNNAPPVTPKPKTGYWIDDKCSVCGKGIEDLIDSREWYRNEEPNFCPFCGVRVVESEDRE